MGSEPDIMDVLSIVMGRQVPGICLFIEKIMIESCFL